MGIKPKNKMEKNPEITLELYDDLLGEYFCIPLEKWKHTEKAALLNQCDEKFTDLELHDFQTWRYKNRHKKNQTYIPPDREGAERRFCQGVHYWVDRDKKII